MEHKELMKELELRVGDDFRFQPGQAHVMHAYHEGNGRVAVGAGAGTGKTTTLTRVVAEVVLRNCARKPADLSENPFNDILVTTFTRDAAGQLKTTIKRILRNHEAKSKIEFDQDIWRWLETASEIGTIDSFVQDLLREIATDVGVAPGFDIRDELDTRDLRQQIFRDLRDDPKLEQAIELLEDEFEDNDTTPRGFIYDIHQKLREFCHEFEDNTSMFSEQFRTDLHRGNEPPFEPTDITDIIAQITIHEQHAVDSPDDKTIDGIEADYYHNIAFLEAVEDLVDAFEEKYDSQTRKTGALSYTDITYIVWEYLDSEHGAEFENSLQQRFSHVFIDEFQDTSYAQCQILSHVISTDRSAADEALEENLSRTNVLVIGDVKQSIYGWRSADPEIFASILDHAAGGAGTPDPYLGVDDWTRAELETNFRSHPHLVRAANHLFSQLFTDPGRGDIGSFDVNYQSLNPFRDETQPTEPHLHVIPLGEDNTEAIRAREPQVVAAAIHGILENASLEVRHEEVPEDTDKSTPTRPAKAGDFTLLFRRSRFMQRFRQALDNHGIQNAVVAEKGLFKKEEVGFLIDVLDWFANPHSKESLLRILRSPITALSDTTLRYIASNELDLLKTLKEWPEGDLPDSDRIRLQHLVDLRNDLRWDREGSKAELVQSIIQHTALETILLSGQNARQKYGNLWVFVEVTRDWEDEELLPYREFVTRLRRYQELARGSNGQFEVAAVADGQDDEAVKIRTVHGAKGLEFDIVVLADLLAGPGGSPTGQSFLPMRDANQRELAIHPRHAATPVHYSPGPGTNWIHSDFTGSIWVTDQRADDGSLLQPHPFNAAVADELAEYWRLLYVGFTRAGDHLITPLADNLHHSQRWTTWNAALNFHFRPGGQWEAGRVDVSPLGIHPDDTNHTEKLPIGVDELPFAEEIEPNPIGLEIDWSSSTEAPDVDETSDAVTESAWTGIDFAPRALSPSTLHDIIACPRRFQYRALQEVSEARGASPPGTNNPEGTTPSSWGSLVHHALEILHEDYRAGTLGTAGSDLAGFLRDHNDIRSDIEAVVRQYRQTSTWDEVQEASTVLPEYELSALHPLKPQIHIQGFVDLLYRLNDEWYIVDFKTGKVANPKSYLFRQYKWQLTTYAWLLNEEYGLDVADARIIYVQDGIEESPGVDRHLFADYLRDLDNRLPVESGSGLPTRPDPDPGTTNKNNIPEESRCGICPYISICPAWQE